MKIQKIKIKEFKVLHDLEKEINGNNIILLGDNGVGKSSFIQFIEIAMGKSTNIPPNALGEGEIVTDKNGAQYIFKVKMKEGKAQVTIQSPDGLKDTSKRALATLVGATEFDIMEFVELSKSIAGRKKQVEIFKSFLPAETREEINRAEANVAIKYAERTEINKGVKSYEAEIAAHPLVSLPNTELLAIKPVDIKAVYAQLQETQKHNSQVTEVNTRLLERNKQMNKIEEDMERLAKELESLKQQNAQATEWLNKNPKMDTTIFESQISEADQTNNKHRQAQELIKKRENLELQKSQSEDATVLIESSRQAISDAIKDMSQVIPGLTFDAENLLYNGIPVNPDSLSTSEIMELGIRLKMAENPELGILFIQRGESLGEKRLKEIKEIANKAGWQIILEQVMRGKEELEIQIMAE